MQMLSQKSVKGLNAVMAFRQVCSIVIVSLLGSITAHAQLATWNPSGLSGYGPSPWVATTANTNLTVTGMVRGAGVGVSGSAAGSAWGGVNWAGAANQDATFTITANAGYQVSYSALNLFYRRSGTGPSDGTLQYAIGAGAYTTIATWSFSSTSSSGAALPAAALSSIANLQNVPAGTVVKFRILPTAGASAGTWYIFSSGLSITGTVAVAAPACTGVTTGTIINNGANTACGTATRILSLNGATATGVNYQWKSSTDSLVWSNAGTNNDSLNTGAITRTMYYKAIVSCASGTVKDSTPAYKITVNPVLTPSVTITASTNDTICAGTPVTFTAIPVNGGTTPLYEWRKGASIVGTNAGTYTDSTLADGDVINVSMTSSATCASVTPVMGNDILMTVNPVLVPLVSIDNTPGDTICAGTPVMFTAMPVNGGAVPIYEWKKGAVIVGGNSAAYIDNALADGDVITVSLISNAQCATTAPVFSTAITMTVNPVLIPSVAVRANPGDTICAGTAVTFTALPVNGGNAPVYLWKKGTATVGTTGASYTDNTLADGDVITVSLMSNAVCVLTTPAPVTAGITMKVNPVLTPSVSITANTGDTICAGTTVTFTAIPLNGGISPVYQWRRGNTVLTATGSIYTNNALSDGDIITVSMVSNATCANTAPIVSNGITMNVNPILTPSVTIASSAGTTGCLGSAVTFTATPVNGGSAPFYQWRKGAVAVGVNSAVYIDNGIAAGDVISVTMTGNANCATTVPVASTGIQMTMNTPLTPDVTILANPGDTVCAGMAVTYVATPVNGGSLPIYVWKKNGTIVFSSNNAVYTNAAPADNDTVMCILASNLGCLTKSLDTAVVITKVNPLVTPTIAITASPGTSVSAGTNVTYTASIVNGGTAPVYQWRKNNIPTGTNSNVYTSNTWVAGDTISCMALSSNICASPDSAKSNLLVMKNPNGVMQVKGTGNNISLYPNPNTGIFTLSGSIINGKDVSVKVVSIVGRVVYQEQFAVDNGPLNKQIHLPDTIANGTYFLRMHTAAGTDMIRFNVSR